jgi:hypothetical protein
MACLGAWFKVPWLGRLEPTELIANQHDFPLLAGNPGDADAAAGQSGSLLHNTTDNPCQPQTPPTGMLVAR